jgi:hypothetical protein
VRLCSATRNTPVDNTARKLRGRIDILSEEVKFRHSIDRAGKKMSSFCGLSEEIWDVFTFYIFVSICNFKLWTIFVFRHNLISDLTLTRAIHLISAYALNTGYLENSDQKFVDIRCDRTSLRFLPPCKLHHSLLQRSSFRANIVRCSC